MRREDGGVLTKLVAWLVLLAVAASVGLFAYVRLQRPLTAETATATTVGAGPADAVRLTPEGRIVVATTVVNDGRWPVTLTGLAEDRARGGDPYVATELGLGDGDTATLDALVPFAPLRLEPGQGVGVVVVFTPNPGQRCRQYPEDPTSESVIREIDSFGVAFELAGIRGDQVVVTDEPFATVGPVTRAACEAVAA
ncbi:MAG TPA: hypothetical protein VF235_00645 [Actinomycetota bacterium]